MFEKESQSYPYNSISRVLHNLDYLERERIRNDIETVFFYDMDGALNRKMTPRQKDLLQIAVDDHYRPDDEGYLGVRFISEPGGPMMRVVMKQCEDCPGDPDGSTSMMIAIAFNVSNKDTSTWLNQTLPEKTVETGIKTLIDAARILGNELKKYPGRVAHRSEFVKE